MSITLIFSFDARIGYTPYRSKSSVVEEEYFRKYV